MFSICKSEWTKSSSYLLDLEPLKHSIAEHMMAKDTLALIQERVSNNNNNNNNNNKNNTLEALLASTLVSDQL